MGEKMMKAKEQSNKRKELKKQLKKKPTTKKTHFYNQINVEKQKKGTTAPSV